MRCYFFTNFYLSSIQKGIQSQHCSAEMFVKYQIASAQRGYLLTWAEDHKTSIVLNGGNHADLNELADKVGMLADQINLPWATFNEDEISLNNATTCVGIVVPEKIYEAASKLRSREWRVVETFARDNVVHLTSLTDGNIELSSTEFFIAELLNSCALAN